MGRLSTTESTYLPTCLRWLRLPHLWCLPLCSPLHTCRALNTYLIWIFFIAGAPAALCMPNAVACSIVLRRQACYTHSYIERGTERKHTITNDALENRMQP